MLSAKPPTERAGGRSTTWSGGREGEPRSIDVYNSNVSS